MHNGRVCVCVWRSGTERIMHMARPPQYHGNLIQCSREIMTGWYRSLVPEDRLLQRNEISTFDWEKRARVMANHYRYARVRLGILAKDKLAILVSRNLHVQPLLLVSEEHWSLTCKSTTNQHQPYWQRVFVCWTFTSSHEKASFWIFGQ